MTNYLLSIDPSMRNTGFTLWEKEKWIDEEPCHVECKDNTTWKPILVTSYSFKKYGIDKFHDFMNKIIYGSDLLYLIIERGTFHSKNGIGYETQEHLRGFIAGQFNKLLTKNMLISPKEWQNWYYKEQKELLQENQFLSCWIKENSIIVSNNLIKENNWNITISNHDEADSLLIGWYFLNKEKNNEN